MALCRAQISENHVGARFRVLLSGSVVTDGTGTLSQEAERASKSFQLGRGSGIAEWQLLSFPSWGDLTEWWQWMSRIM
jgi:hypothetical protein